MLLKHLPIRSFVINRTLADGSAHEVEIFVSTESAQTLMELRPETRFDLHDNSIEFYLPDRMWDLPIAAITGEFDDLTIVNEMPSTCNLLVAPKEAFTKKTIEVVKILAGYPKTHTGDLLLELPYAAEIMDRDFPSGKIFTGDLREYGPFATMFFNSVTGLLKLGYTHLVISNDSAAVLVERRRKLNIEDDRQLKFLTVIHDDCKRPWAVYKVHSQFTGLTYAIRASIGNNDDETFPGRYIAVHDDDGELTFKMNSNGEYQQFSVVGKVEHMDIGMVLSRGFHAHYENIMAMVQNT